MRRLVSPLDGIRSPFGGRFGFSPRALFSSGAQGIWLDPSDLTTMFSDRAGTTPVTTPGTVVGKRLDKSGNGNHAVAPTDAARPTYGIEPKTGRRNLLTRTEEFNAAVWVKTLASITSTSITDPLGGSTADEVTLIGATADKFISFSITAPTTSSTISFAIKAGTHTFLQLLNNGDTEMYANFNASTGVVGNAGTRTTTSVTHLGNNWYRVSATFAPGTFGSSFRVFAISSSTAGYGSSTASTGTFYIWGAQLETGSTATAYQKVTTAFDVTEAGVPTCHYVQYDGSDDSLSTSSIDFTATDKMSVFAGVRKNSDAAQGAFVELSATIASNNGAFLLAAPDGATATFGFDSKGTVQVDAVASSLTAPITRLVTGLANIAGDTATIRINGVQADQDTGDQGTGNFGNYPLFIGRRNNATLPFNGRDYGIIVAGKAASASEITSTEAWLAAKTAEVTL